MSSWPFFTVSPSRALMLTTRPVAIEITGTVRKMSGATTPVTTSCEDALRATATDNGNCSVLSTLTTLASAAASTFAGGGASAAGSGLRSPPQPPSSRRAADRQTDFGAQANIQSLRAPIVEELKARLIAKLIALPRVPPPDSTGLRPADKK